MYLLLLLIILLVIVVIFIYALIKWILHFVHFYKHLKSIPSPPTYPIIGNILSCKTRETLKMFSDLFKRYNTKLLRIHLGMKTGIYVKDYKFLELVLTSNVVFSDENDCKILSNWLGTGNLPKSGDIFKQREMLTPELHMEIMEQFSSSFNKVSDILVENLKRETLNDSTDIHPLVSLYTVDIMCETAIGSSMKAQTLADTSYFKTTMRIFNIMQRRIFITQRYFKVLFKFTEAYKTQRKVLNFIKEHVQTVIAKRKAIIMAKMEEIAHENPNNLAFVDLLLRVDINGSSLSDSRVRKELKDFMLGGHDLLSASTSFLLYALSKHQDVQMKVYKEIIEELGTDETYQPTFKDLQRLKYLEMVIKETLRMYPPIPVITIDIKEDLKYKDIVIPKGCALRICTYQMHRDPDYYENPEKFDPERFAKAEVDSNVFISFSAGPQNCIEHKFVMFLLKFTVIKVLRHFVLKQTIPEHELEIEQLATLSSANGMFAKIEPRI